MKFINSTFIITGLLSFLTGCMGQGKKEQLNYEDDKFKAGQIWKYQTRRGEENSTLTILKVERYDTLGVVIHIAVNGVKINNPNAPGGITNTIPHMPFSKDAISQSVTELVAAKNKLPDFEGGYDEWKKANGGVFTISVSDAVKYVEDAISGAVKK